MALPAKHQDAAPATFGFMTVVEVASLGHCGGLLVVSSIGRPIEFHFTTPVATSRTQEIMYGETYRGFLYGDRIGAALVDKAKQLPTVFVTDSPDMLPICELIDTPLLLTLPTPAREDQEPFDGSGLKHFNVANETVYCLNVGTGEEAADQINLLKYHASQFRRSLPFDEPFERIRQAICEANQVLKAA